MKIILMILFLSMPTISFSGINVRHGAGSSYSGYYSNSTRSNSFRQGWKDGYVEGWRYVLGQYSIRPIVPIPPIPPIGKNSYKGGYNIGFLRGISDANRY